MLENRKYIYLWSLIGVGVFFLIAGVLLAILNQTPSAVTTATPASVEQVKRVSVADAKAAFDASNAVFVDVRDSASYARSHIPGALSIPLNELTDHLGELDPTSWIITYCT